MNERIRQLRTMQGMTQAELAGKLGVSASAVGMYEQGRREPDSAVLKKMAAVFHVSVDYLLGDTQEQEIGDMIDSFTKILKSSKGLMFNGEPISDADREKVVNAIRVAAAIAAPGDSHDENY